MFIPFSEPKLYDAFLISTNEFVDYRLGLGFVPCVVVYHCGAGYRRMVPDGLELPNTWVSYNPRSLERHEMLNLLKKTLSRPRVKENHNSWERLIRELEHSGGDFLVQRYNRVKLIDSNGQITFDENAHSQIQELFLP